MLLRSVILGVGNPTARAGLVRADDPERVDTVGGQREEHPTPSALPRWASYTTASMSAFCSAMATAGPAMPPPMTTAVRVRLMARGVDVVAEFGALFGDPLAPPVQQLDDVGWWQRRDQRERGDEVRVLVLRLLFLK